MKAPSAKDVERALKTRADAAKAAFYPRFFKTAKGEYGEGDKFIGVVVPEQRKVARKFKDITKTELKNLLGSPFHECRLTALFILVLQYQSSRWEKDHKAIYRFYMQHITRVNNWDLVDASCYKIVGAYLHDYTLDREPLFKLAKMKKKLWHNRIAIISTLYFIKKGDYTTTIDIATLLVHHKHDLIHKAVGWMLREVGKGDESLMMTFIRTHYENMPRTMLRYSIEKLAKPRQKAILSGSF